MIEWLFLCDPARRLAIALSPQAFKIFPSIAISAHGRVHIARITLHIPQTVHGESKLGTMVALNFIAL